jgi:hypothetical protein
MKSLLRIASPGMLVLSLGSSPPRAAKPQDIRLRIKTLEFTPADLESTIALDP